MTLYGIDWQFEDASECQYRNNENFNFNDLPHHFDEDLVTQLKGTKNSLGDSMYRISLPRFHLATPFCIRKRVILKGLPGLRIEKVGT